MIGSSEGPWRPHAPGATAFPRLGARRSAGVLAALAAGVVASTAIDAPPAAAQAITAICAVQGAGSRSPLADGTVVTTRGVVAGAFLGPGVALSDRGFFLQDDGPDGGGCDGEEATSDGLFVYAPSGIAASLESRVAVGMAVTVTGSVSEYYGQTQIAPAAADAVTSNEGATASLPRAVALEPPADPASAIAYLEAREGMRVVLPPSRVVAATNAHGVTYALPVESGVDRLFRGGADSRLRGLAAPGAWLALDHGAALPEVVGVLTHAYGEHRVLVGGGDPAPTAQPRPVPTAAPTPSREVLRVATYNLHDHFDTVDDRDKEDPVRSADAYALQTARRARSISAHLGAPDVVGVQEVENLAVLQALADHPALAAAGYRAMLLEEDVAGRPIGRDLRGIDVGFLYRAWRVQLVGLEQRPTCATDPDVVALLRDGAEQACVVGDVPGRWLFDRPPLVARFRVVATQGRLVVINNHFRSMSGDDDTTPVRVAMAEHVRAIVDAEHAADPSAALVVLGDLNAFEDGPVLATLKAGGALVDAHDRVPAAERYTYAFNGLHQILDYVLVPPDVPVAAVRIAHANVDHAAPPDLLADEGPRASDHDAVVADIPVEALRYWAFLPVAGNAWALTESGASTPPDVGTGTAEPPTAGATATIAATPSPPPPTPGPTAERPTSTVPTPDCGTPIVFPWRTATPSPSDPPRWPLRISALNHDGCVPDSESDEYVEVENVSDAAVDLWGWSIRSDTGGQRYGFARARRIDAGGRCRVYTNQDHSATEPCAFNWSSGRSVWNNDGDAAILTGPTGAVVDRVCYGTPPGGC